MTDLLKTAKLYENSKMTKREAVSNFGTEGQQRHFTKYKKFTNKETEASLIRTLEQLFEAVDKVKSGRSIVYKVGSVREEVAERESKVQTNGNWKEYTKHLDALILAQLEWTYKGKKDLDKTIKQWMCDFGLLNDNHLALTNMDYYPSDKSRVENLMRNTPIGGMTYLTIKKDEREEVKKFFYQDFLSKKRTFISTLKRLEREGIVELYKIPVAYLVREKGEQSNPIALQSNSYQSYIRKRNELLEKYKIELSMLSRTDYYRSQKSIESAIRNEESMDEALESYGEVVREAENELHTVGDEIYFRIQEYNKELSDYLQENFVAYDANRERITKPISHILLHVAIIRVGTKKEIMKYLNKYSPEVLSDYLDYKEEKEKYVGIQENKYRETNRKERFNALETKKQKDLKKAREKDMEMSLDGVNPSGFSMREVEYFYQRLMTAVESLEETFREDFKINEKIVQRNKERDRK